MALNKVSNVKKRLKQSNIKISTPMIFINIRSWKIVCYTMLYMIFSRAENRFFWIQSHTWKYYLWFSWISSQYFSLVFITYPPFKNIREGGEIGLFNAPVPKILWYRFLIRWLKNFEDFYWILIGWFIKMSIQTIQQLIVIYRMGNFLHYFWRCPSIYRAFYVTKF